MWECLQVDKKDSWYMYILRQNTSYISTATVVLQKLFAGRIFAEHGPFLQATYVISHYYIYSQVYFYETEWFVIHVHACIWTLVGFSYNYCNRKSRRNHPLSRLAEHVDPAIGRAI